MYLEFTVALQSVKTLLDIIKASQDLPNHNEVLAAVSDVEMKIMCANSAAIASHDTLAQQVRELETQLGNVEDWKTQMQSYELVEFPTKALAFKLKAVTTDGVPIHYLCTACADRKKMTTLQPRKRFLHCPECKSLIAVQDPPPRKSNPRAWKVH
ncbi:MAG: hypothetical protein IPM58_12915 [Nitrospira sp.]|nr:hypothetical protein [Nitrospira sp.]